MQLERQNKLRWTLAPGQAHRPGSRARTRTGAPEPPPIFIGNLAVMQFLELEVAAARWPVERVRILRIRKSISVAAVMRSGSRAVLPRREAPCAMVPRLA